MMNIFTCLCNIFRIGAYLIYKQNYLNERCHENKIFFSVVIICLLVCNQTINAKRVVGNKNVVTRVINIQDYSKIDVGGSMEFIYEESSADPYLEITVDENILPYLRIEVKKNKLEISPDKEGRNTEIQPTKYQIKTNSTSLSKGDFAGSGSFTLKNLKRSKKVEIDMAGSGRTVVETVAADELKLEMAGSGRIQVNNAKVKYIKGELAGSGKMEVNGEATEGKFELAGSGKIDAENCPVKKAKAEIAGSGSIYVQVADELSGSIAGSGNLYYKGHPTHLNTDTAGSGKVRSRN